MCGTGAYSTSRNRCETAYYNSCIAGTTYNSSSGKCEVAATCNSGGSLNSTSDKCEFVVSYSCPTSYNPNPVSGKCEATLSCLTGGTYDANTDLCAVINTWVCPQGMSLTGSTCYITAMCPSGGSLNNATDKCVLTRVNNCITGYSYNSSLDNCQSNPVCSVGVYDNVIDKCKVVASAICPSGYTANEELDICMMTPPCPTGSLYSTTTDNCMRDAVHDCPTGTAYTPEVRLCISEPACTTGNYDVVKNECYVGNNTCPLGSSYACINNGNNQNQCSPNPCVDITVPANVVLEAVDDRMLQNDGQKDEQGNCLGEVYIFTGRGLRCRTSGIDSGWQNCCVKGDAVLKDSVGKLMDMGSAVNAIQTVYHLGQVAYLSNYAITCAWTAEETMATLNAAGYASDVVAASAAAVDAGTVGVGMQKFMMSAFNPTTVAAGIAIKLAVDFLLSGGCDQQDLETAMMVASGRCHYVGEWCEKKWPLIGCVQKSEGWCCFNSKLARIIHEQGRPQLKAFQPSGGWGTEKPAAPNCRGFTSAEFQMLDFSKIDLSEYFGEITAKAQSEIITGTQNKITDFYDKIQGK